MRVQRFRTFLTREVSQLTRPGPRATLRPASPKDEDAKPAFERVSGDPGFMRSLGVFAARDDGRFDALATLAGEPLDVENRERYRAKL